MGLRLNRPPREFFGGGASGQEGRNGGREGEKEGVCFSSAGV